MEISEGLSQQERLQAIAEKRKKQTEIENKKRQLEDDRRQLQHLKSKALRERWLLDGAPSAGSEQDEAKKQLEEDEAKTRSLEETIMRMEQELVELETGGTLSATHTKEDLQEDLHNEVIEDSETVVHEMNGESDVHQLSSLEVDELIHKADEVSMVSHTVSGVTVTAITTAEAQDVTVSAAAAVPRVEEAATPEPAPESPGGEAAADEAGPQGVEVGIGEASADNPVTMVFMGYQSVEDEAETKKVLGLEGTVKAELVLIEDGEGKTSPVTPDATPAVTPPKEKAPQTAPPNGTTAPATATTTVEPPAPSKAEERAASDGEKTEPEVSTADDLKNKEKQPCKCCTIM